jgi:serine phosphatase RsbU (regulator of sigma subunit)
MRLGVGSLMAVPLRARGRSLGAIWLGASRSGRRYSEEDLATAEDLARRAALAVDNARLFQERRRVADTLQASLLPPHLPVIAGLELASVYQAAGEANEIGGDFFDLFETPQGAWALIIGDVCGKGTDAAAVTGLARYTVRAAAMRERTPSGVLEMLNEAILRQGHDERFCTATFALVQPARSGARLTLSRGGHMAPLLLRRDGAVEAIGHAGMLIGLFPDPDLADDTAELGQGDVLVLCTDGVTEARGPEGIYGAGRLRDLVAGCRGMGAKEIARRIEQSVMQFQEGRPRDDLAVLVLRVDTSDVT